MLKEEREARIFIRAAIQSDCDKPVASRLIRKMVQAARNDILRVARECHHHHRCNHLDPCELCRLMNPKWEPVTIRSRK